MDQLINRWKNTMSQVDQKYKSRENSREKPVPTIKKEPSDSEDDDYYFKNKEIKKKQINQKNQDSFDISLESSIQTRVNNQTLESSLQISKINKTMESSVQVSKIRKNSKNLDQSIDSSVQISKIQEKSLENIQKSPETESNPLSLRQMSNSDLENDDQIDTLIKKLLKITSSQEQNKHKQIRILLDDLVDQQLKQYKNEQQLLANQQKQKNNLSKIESQSRIMTEIENKLFEAEREKINIRNQRDQLDKQVQILQNQIKQNKENDGIIDLLKNNLIQLQEESQIIQNENKQYKLKYEEQQYLFQQQVNEFQILYNKLNEKINDI